MATPTDSSTSLCTRRRILGWGGAGAIAGLAGYLGWPRDPSEVSHGKNASSAARAPGQSEAAPAPAELVRDGSLRDDFLPHLNSKFRIQAPELAGMDCVLVEISPSLKMTGPAGEFTSFSLLFSAPAESAAESRIYQVSHREMGAMDLFLSPVGKSEERVNLEAVFSQRV